MTKPTQWHVCPAKTQISLGFLSYPLSTQRRLLSDWVDARADLSLCWAHSHFVGFVMRRLNFECPHFSDFYCNFSDSTVTLKTAKIGKVASWESVFKRLFSAFYLAYKSIPWRNIKIQFLILQCLSKEKSERLSQLHLLSYKNMRTSQTFEGQSIFSVLFISFLSW